MPSYNPYKRYNFVEKDQNSKGHSPHNLTCHFCCKKCHTIEKCKFMRPFAHKGVFQCFPKCNLDFTHPQGSNEDRVPSVVPQNFPSHFIFSSNPQLEDHLHTHMPHTYASLIHSYLVVDQCGFKVIGLKN